MAIGGQDVQASAGARPGARPHQTEPVRLCLVQYRMRALADWEAFAAHVSGWVALGAGEGADFVVFPELFSTQLLSCLPAAPGESPEQSARRLAAWTPRLVGLFGELAVQHGVNIVGGSHFALEGERLYNVAYLAWRDGGGAEQKKLHVTPNEGQWWGVRGGDGLTVFDTDRGRVAILICYDVEFPELARIAVAEGARLLFVPFNTHERRGYLRVRRCAQARAIENQVYVAIAGCAGRLTGLANVDEHYAQSALFTPSDHPFARDAVAAECEPNAETMLVEDLDLALLRLNREEGTVRPWVDRRLDLYAVAYRDAAGGERRV